ASRSPWPVWRSRSSVSGFCAVMTIPLRLTLLAALERLQSSWRFFGMEDNREWSARLEATFSRSRTPFGDDILACAILQQRWSPGFSRLKPGLQRCCRFAHTHLVRETAFRVAAWNTRPTLHKWLRSLALGRFAVRARQEAEELGGPVLAFAPAALHGLKEAQFLLPAAEIAPVELTAEDGLGQRLQLAKRKLLRQQLEAHGRFADATAQVGQAHVEQLRVVERQRGQFTHVVPAHVGGAAGGAGGMLVSRDEADVNDGNDALARVAVRRADGADLLQIDVAHPGVLGQLAKGGVHQVFLDPHEPAGQRPLA